MYKIKKYKPFATKSMMLFLAGFVWLCVGVMLLSFAFSWLSATVNVINIGLFVGIGIFVSLFIHHFGFLKIVNKNSKRIMLMDEKNCLFSFMPNKSYLLVGVMIAMGAVLRRSLIPKQYLAVLYISIGLALMLSSIRYIRLSVKEVRK